MTANMGLETYTGAWDAPAARHLLRRCIFGPSARQVDQALELGMDAAIERLLAPRPEPDPPVKDIPDPTGPDDFTPTRLRDPEVAYGETWIHAAPFPGNTLRPMDRNRILRYRLKSQDAWTFLLMLDGELSIRERLTMFWHNHFVVADMAFGQRVYQYARLLRAQALGNSRDLTKAITLDTGMLTYLNGTDNSQQAPNENYARELLELFTVGKGALAGPGDYSTFTETDVIQMARVLTGWQVPVSRRGDPLSVSFVPARHTPGDKRLSARFGGAVIREAGEQEYALLIDLIFEQEACALHLVRELYRWFVGPEIDAGVEEALIQPLAAVLREADYEIRPVLRVLLASAHFQAHRGCMIKSPVDLLLSGTQGLGMPRPLDGPEADYGIGIMLAKSAEELGMGVFKHPTVAGWEAYHQAPQYDRYWLNNLSYPKRQDYLSALILGGTVQTESENFSLAPLVPVLDLAAGIDEARDPKRLIEGLAEMLYPAPISQAQRDFLKDALIPGLPDYEWTVEYSDFLADPTGPLRAPVIARLQKLLVAMVQMPEFQLM